MRPLIASTATLALNSGLWVRRLLTGGSPVQGRYPASEVNDDPFPQTSVHLTGRLRFSSSLTGHPIEGLRVVGEHCSTQCYPPISSLTRRENCAVVRAIATKHIRLSRSLAYRQLCCGFLSGQPQARAPVLVRGGPTPAYCPKQKWTRPADGSSPLIQV